TGFTLNGTIYLGNASGSSDGYLTFTSTPFIASMSGGEIVFGGSAANKINATGDQGFTFLIEPNITIRGHRGEFNFGDIAAGHHGRTAVAVAGGSISLSGRVFENVGTLEAKKRAALKVSGIAATFTNSGTVFAGARAKPILTVPCQQAVGCASLQRGSL